MDQVSFISKLAKHIQSRYDLTKQELTVVFPNKRAAFYLRNAFKTSCDQTIWLPQMISIEEAVTLWSGITLADSMDLLFDDDDQLVGWMNKSEKQFKWVDESKSALRQAQGPSLKEMAFSGLHFFRSDLFAKFECKPQSVIDLYLNLAKNNRILSKPIQPNYWFDLGKPEQLQAAENYIKTL